MPAIVAVNIYISCLKFHCCNRNRWGFGKAQPLICAKFLHWLLNGTTGMGFHPLWSLEKLKSEVKA